MSFSRLRSSTIWQYPTISHSARSLPFLPKSARGWSSSSSPEPIPVFSSYWLVEKMFFATMMRATSPREFAKFFFDRGA